MFPTRDNFCIKAVRNNWFITILLTLYTFSVTTLAENTLEPARAKTPVQVAVDIPSAEQEGQPSIQFLSLESTIVGNKEQPKIITIVPWQTPQQNRIETSPIAAQIKSVFEPVEVESVKKELEYFHRYN